MLTFDLRTGRYTKNTDTKNLAKAIVQIAPIILKTVLSTIQEGRLTKDNIVRDSRASTHSFNDLRWFSTITTMPTPYEATGVGGRVRNTKAGIVKLDFVRFDGTVSHGTLKVVYTPEVPVNLISIGEFK